MIEIKVNSEHEYTVIIGAEWRKSLEVISSSYSKVLIIAPEALRSQLELSYPYIFYTPDGESQKSVSTAEKIWGYLGEIQLGRRDAVVGIGGGATTDLAGFIAATWLRGVAWFAFPTTLSAMVDASVGGKTGINSSAGKNLIGAFHSPKSVIADLGFLDSLTDRDFSAGLAEVIKVGLIADPEILTILTKTPTIAGARSLCGELVARSIQVKADVVSRDFKEGELREILNFGHTFGHALEKLRSYELRHGEAVSVGLVYALYLSESLLSLDSTITRNIIDMLEKFSLPVRTKDLGWEESLRVMQSDKKSRAQQLRFIGIDQVAHPVWLESVPIEAARSAYGRIIV